MSANIQFIETGNLLSPDKGDMSGLFLCYPVLVRCVDVSVWGGCRRLVSSGLTRAGVVVDRILKRSYPSAESGELRAGSVCLGRTLLRAVALVGLPVPVVGGDGPWPLE